MLKIARFAKIYATGPEDPLRNRYCFHCLNGAISISMTSRELYELKRHYQLEQHLVSDQHNRARFSASKKRGSDGRIFMGLNWQLEGSLVCT